LNTKVLVAKSTNLSSIAADAAHLLKKGEVVVVPTETVYGLAAQIYDEDAVKRIFEVKGRPQDNPLIVHIASLDMLPELVVEIPESAKELIRRFWPGPLTIIFKKKSNVSDTITCGMDTVAIRFPVHPVAMEIIRQTGIPLAAPSANLSGKPSPTTAEHCVNDLDGKVPLIVDGGPCEVGVESTVISVAGAKPTILRPGIISLEEIRSVVPEAEISESVFRKVGENEPVASPGLKYKHYAPNCDVVLVDSDSARYVEYVNHFGNEKEYAMCFSEEAHDIRIPVAVYGSASDPEEQARNIFDLLRSIDKTGAQRIYVHAPGESGKSLAVSNRLMRAAGFQVVKLR